MKSVYWYQAVVFELDYTSDFHGVIEMRSDEKGLVADVILANRNTKEEIHVGTCISKEYEIKDCHEYSCNLLQNEEYCLGVWESHY